MSLGCLGVSLLFSQNIFAHNSHDKGPHSTPEAIWQFDGNNTSNTRFSEESRSIDPKNINNLNLKWVYESPGGAVADQGFRSSPVVKDGILYVGDVSGYLHAVDTQTGQPLNSNWPILLKNVELGTGPDDRLLITRSPAIVGDKIVVSGWKTFAQGGDAVCLNNRSPSVNGCAPRVGARVAVFNRFTGALIWSTIVDRYYGARITTSPMVHNNVIYVGVSSGEERALRNATRASITGDPADAGKPYPCCGHKGSIVALDLETGNILWKTYMAPLDYDPLAEPEDSARRQYFTQPDMSKPPIGHFDKWTNGHRLNYNVFAATPANEANVTTAADLVNYNRNEAGFSGNSVWGSTFVIDKERNRLYAASSNGYNAPRAYKECRLYRIDPSAIADPDISVFGIPGKTKCSQLSSLNEINNKVGFFSAQVLSLDLNTGEILASYAPQEYDLWHFACSPPALNFEGFLDFRSFNSPTPTAVNGNFSYKGYLANTLNCPSMILLNSTDVEPCATGDQASCEANVDNKIKNKLVGRDAAFAQGPMLIQEKNEHGKASSLVGAVDKDSIFVVLDPDNSLKPLPVYQNKNVDPFTGQLLDGIRVSPGGIIGGVHMSGQGYDGKYAYFAASNSKNAGRDVTMPYIESFLDAHRPFEDPSNDNMLASPFANTALPFLRVLDSGPELYKLTNPPSDVVADAIGDLIPSGDGKHCHIDGSTMVKIGPNKDYKLPPMVIKIRNSIPSCQSIAKKNDIVTASGIYTKFNVHSGKIVWQRPTIPIIPEALDMANLPNTAAKLTAAPITPSDNRGRGLVYGGGITLANGLLYSSLADQQSSFLAIDTNSGRLVFECHGTTLGDKIGADATGSPTVIDDTVYFTNGGEFVGNPVIRSGGIGYRIYAFELGPKQSSHPIVCLDLSPKKNQKGKH